MGNCTLIFPFWQCIDSTHLVYRSVVLNQRSIANVFRLFSWEWNDTGLCFWLFIELLCQGSITVHTDRTIIYKVYWVAAAMPGQYMGTFSFCHLMTGLCQGSKKVHTPLQLVDGCDLRWEGGRGVT